MKSVVQVTWHGYRVACPLWTVTGILCLHGVQKMKLQLYGLKLTLKDERVNGTKNMAALVSKSAPVAATCEANI